MFDTRMSIGQAQNIACIDVYVTQRKAHTSTFIIRQKTLVNLREDIVRTNCFFSSVWWQLPLFFYLFYLFHTFIITFIGYIHSYSFAEASPFSSLLVWEKPPWGTEPGLNSRA